MTALIHSAKHKALLYFLDRWLLPSYSLRADIDAVAQKAFENSCVVWLEARRFRINQLVLTRLLIVRHLRHHDVSDPVDSFDDHRIGLVCFDRDFIGQLSLHLQAYERVGGGNISRGRLEFVLRQLQAGMSVVGVETVFVVVLDLSVV